MDEALPIAKQIAEALEAAHEAGVIHRDLKPANIKVRDDGTVKVLDFGLAKALDTTPQGDPSLSPTLTAAATQMGVIMGTAAYMSPEQARGKTVDKRADIWSFGCVLYEMLTGQRAFQGEDVSLTLASVMKSDLNVKTLPHDVPATVRTVLRRCLEKDPRERIRDVGDVRLAMAGRFDVPNPPPVEPAVAVRLRVWQRPASLMLVAVALVAITSLAVWSVTQPILPALHVQRFAVPPPAPETVGVTASRADVAISPDGTKVVYLATGGNLYVRSVEELEATPLEGLDTALGPFVSPESAWVGFEDARDAALKRVSIRGGPAVTICSLDARLRGASWGPDGTIIFGTNGSYGLWRVPASGGEPEEFTVPDGDQNDVTHRWPHILPGGRAVLFTIVTRASFTNGQIAVLNLETNEQRVLIPAGSHPRYASTGHIVYGVGNTLRAVRFDLDRLEVTDPDPVPVLSGVVTKPNGAASFDLSRGGSLVYITGAGVGGATDRSLVWVDREGREVPLATPLLPYERPRISPDGTHVVVDVVGRQSGDIWIHDLSRGTERILTTDPARDRAPLWTPDGEQVVFESNRGGSVGLFRKSADAPGDAERLMTDTSGAVTLEASSWSPDGQLAFWRAPPVDIGLLSMEGDRTVQMLFDTEVVEAAPAISPDGDWIAYDSNETGQSQVYVQRFPSLGDKKIVSTDGGAQPLWSPNGDELFYRGPRGMMVVPVETEPTFTPGAPDVLFDQQYYSVLSRRTYDLAPDGQRFLMVKNTPEDGAEAPVPQVILVQNWFEELTRLVPTE